jgi:unsaturated rhamnogalacturonyl hydrolase
MAQGIKRYQDHNTGGWYMVVDKGTNAMNYIDPSGTAMFVYSIQRGIDLNLLRKKDYSSVAQRGYDCLRAFIKVNKNGLLDILGGCDGVTIKPDFLTYVTVPKILNAKETVIGMLWAGIIMEKNTIVSQKDK